MSPEIPIPNYPHIQPHFLLANVFLYPSLWFTLLNPTGSILPTFSSVTFSYNASKDILAFVTTSRCLDVYPTLCLSPLREFLYTSQGGILLCHLSQTLARNVFTYPYTAIVLSPPQLPHLHLIQSCHGHVFINHNFNLLSVTGVFFSTPFFKKQTIPQVVLIYLPPKIKAVFPYTSGRCLDIYLTVVYPFPFSFPQRRGFLCHSHPYIGVCLYTP